MVRTGFVQEFRNCKVNLQFNAFFLKFHSFRKGETFSTIDPGLDNSLPVNEISPWRYNGGHAVLFGYKHSLYQ